MALFSIFGNARAAELPRASVTTEEGFVDVSLGITEVKTAKDGTVSITARGTLDGVALGLAFDLLPEWKANDIEGSDAKFYFGKARYRSLGPESDAFLAHMAKLYGISPKPGPMLSRVEVSAVGLNSDPRTLNTGPVKLKCFFFDSGPDDRYAEVFTNIDLKSKRLEFNEKDTEYRSPLIKALHVGA